MRHFLRKRVFRILLLFFSSITCFPHLTAAGSNAGCAGWGTQKYFFSTPESEITNCMKSGVDIKSPRQNKLPFLNALRAGLSPAIISAFLNSGVDPNAVDVFPWNALESLSPHYSPEDVNRITAMLLLAGTNPNYSNNDGWTPLMGTRTITETKLLIQAGANINARTKDGADVLQGAAGSADLATIKLLIAKGLNLHSQDRSGNSLLDLAAMGNPNPDVFRYFIAQGMSIHEKGQGGHTPIQLASMFNYHPLILKTLASLGADLTQKDAQGRDLLHLAATSPVGADNISMLLSLGLPVNGKDAQGNEPLHLAALNGWSSITESLIKGGANINAFNYKGYTPLLETGFHLNSWMNVKPLVDAGGNLNARDPRGMTPLMIAAKEINWPAQPIDTFLALGADASLRDKTGKSAADYAKINPAFHGSSLQIFNLKPILDKLEAAANRPLPPAIAPTLHKLEGEILKSYSGDIGQIDKVSLNADYAALAANIYGGDNPFPLPNGWSPTMSKPFKVPNIITGDLIYQVYEGPSGQYALVFEGTTEFRQWIDNIPGAIFPTALLYQVQKVALYYKKVYPNVVFVGHSLGGRLANFARLVTGNDAVVFDASGTSLPEKLDANITGIPGGHLTSFRSPQDPVSGMLHRPDDIVVENLGRVSGFSPKQETELSAVALGLKAFGDLGDLASMVVKPLAHAVLVGVEAKTYTHNMEVLALAMKNVEVVVELTGMQDRS